jgi:hypothetical protein
MNVYQYAILCAGKEAEHNLQRPDISEEDRRRDLRTVEMANDLKARLERRSDERTGKDAAGARPAERL